MELSHARDFVRAQTVVASPPLVPEIRLHLASEITPIWQAAEESLAQMNLPPPYWAFAWPGGQAVTRYILDNKATVAKKCVLDFAAGAGLGAIGAALSGAERSVAAEIDAMATVAIGLNAEHNGVRVAIENADLVGRRAQWDVVLAGDVCYERPMATRVTGWLRELASSGVTVLLGDPGRAYLPAEGMVEIARYQVPTTLELEDRTCKETIVWRMVP